MTILNPFFCADFPINKNKGLSRQGPLHSALGIIAIAQRSWRNPSSHPLRLTGQRVNVKLFY